MTRDPSAISSSAADGHLRVDQLSGDLKHRSTRGSALMIVSYAIQLVIGVAGTAVLGRMLKPVNFGYIAMVGTFINFVLSFREFLMTPAVQKEDLTHEQASGLFWINCLVSVVVALAVAAAAPLLAWIFNEPKLTAITVAMAGGILLSMIGMFHVGLLRRKMRFWAISFIEVGSIFAGVVTGVASAVMGAGYWALVIQQVTIWIWQSAVAWWLCPWRPAEVHASAFFKDADVRSMYHFGRDTTISRILQYASRNTDNVLVGYFIGASTLGLYQKAYQWAMLPFWQTYLPMAPVAISSLSRLQDDPQRYRSYARMTLMALFSLTLPATALLAIEADGVIRVLFGDYWIDAIPMLQILCIGAYFSVFSLITNWIYLPEGRSRDQLRWSVVSAPVTMIGVAIGVHWNAMGVSTGFAIASLVLVVPGVWYCLRRSPITTADYVESAWRAVVASLVAGALLCAMRWEFHLAVPMAVQVILRCTIYGVLYLAIWILLPGGRAHFSAILAHVRSLRRIEAAELI